MMRVSLALLFALLLAATAPALAQDAGTLDKAPLPPLPHPDSPSTPAKELFARKTEPVPLAARSIGFYSSGCLAGAVALPINGPTWQVMRLSRNRNWGHPKLIAFLERLAENGVATVSVRFLAKELRLNPGTVTYTIGHIVGSG